MRVKVVDMRAGKAGKHVWHIEAKPREGKHVWHIEAKRDEKFPSDAQLLWFLLCACVNLDSVESLSPMQPM